MERHLNADSQVPESGSYLLCPTALGLWGHPRGLLLHSFRGAALSGSRSVSEAFCSMKHPFLWRFKDFFILNHLDMEWMVNFTLQVRMWLSPFSLWVFFLAGPPCPHRPPTHPLGRCRPVSIITAAQQQVRSLTTQGPYVSQQLRPVHGPPCVGCAFSVVFFKASGPEWPVIEVGMRLFSR